MTPVQKHAIAGSAAALEEALKAEEQTERETDRTYWKPLKAELESLRLSPHAHKHQTAP